MTPGTSRRQFLKTLGYGSLALLGHPILAADPAATDRPNFVIIIADDLAYSDVGAYGHPHIRTPNIDKLAEQGLKFDSAFLTCASCSPTRCSIMTSRYPHNTGAAELHQPLPPDQITFPSLLKEAGYYTVAAGKWHLGNHAKTGFHRIVGSGPSGCELWLDQLRNRPRNKPFFMWLASIDPHRPYKPNTIPNPHKPSDVIVPPFLPDTPETRRDLAAYYDEITRLDGHVGKVLDELDRQNIADNTFVLFLSDNGRPFPRCKTTIYDSGIRTPFIVRWPRKIKPRTTCSSLVSVIDIAPTILELARLQPPPSFQGRSFARLLTDPTQSIRRYIFAEHNWHDYQAHERAVRSRDFLYIRNAFPHLPATPPADAVRGPTFQKMIQLYDAGKLPPHQQTCFVTPRPTEELYNTNNDPYCLHNLAPDPRYTIVLQKMRRILDRWIERTNDRIPSNPTPDKYDRRTGQRLKT